MKDKFRNVYGKRVPHTVDKLLCSNSEHLYLYGDIFTFRHFAVVVVVTVLLSSLRQKMSRKQTPQLKKSELSFVLPIDWAGQWIHNTKILHAFAMQIVVPELAVWAGPTKCRAWRCSSDSAYNTPSFRVRLNISTLCRPSLADLWLTCKVNLINGNLMSQ